MSYSKAQNEANKRYRKGTGKGKQKTFQISVTSEKYETQKNAITAAGFTVSQFWHFCVGLLQRGELPTPTDKQPTDTDGNPDTGND